MADSVGCSRCGSTAEGLGRSPMPGDLGSSIQEQTCAACWKAWLGAQVILINEKQLSPAKPEHFALLVSEMKTFLGLREE